MITPEQGAQTPVYLATQPLSEPQSGRYYDKSKPRRPTALAQDVEAAKRLFDLSEQLIQSALLAD